MSLYQKYRPQKFEEVAGHSTEIDMLKSIIVKSKKESSINDAHNNENKIPHAYIFCGSHGIGKTTLARIFARELGTDASDIYELDAASTSKRLEDMRELIESVYTLPILSKYKVYILDEAHMLTTGSSNAFLKTLEEPPAHVIFILCTTDPEKILNTVRSRCNIMKLNSPSNIEIENRLEEIVKSEEVKIGDSKEESKNILALITKNSNSSYRDAITNLEKVIHSFDGVITLENVEKLFGKTNQESYLEIINLLSIKLKNDEKFNSTGLAGVGLKQIHTGVPAIITWVSQNYKEFSYNTFLEIIRNGIINQNENKNGGSEAAAKDSENFYNFKNLLYFLEKENLYKNTQDKFSGLMAIFGNLK